MFQISHKNRLDLVVALTSILMLLGCGAPQSPEPETVPAPPARTAQPVVPQAVPSAVPNRPEVTNTANPRDQSVEAVAIRRVASAIESTSELGPTTVVWLLDGTETNAASLQRAIREMERWYVDRDSDGNGSDLRSAVLLFGEQSEWLTDEPATSATEVVAALTKIRIDTSVTENSFAAAGEALNRFAAERTTDGRQVIVVILTDEAGDDPEKVDAVAARASRLAIPFYVIGLPAPFGETTVIARPLEKHQDGTPAVVHGPETRDPLHVAIPLAGSHWGADKIDSSYGPFALEYLARASGGQFLALRPDGSDDTPRGLREVWPASDTIRFPNDVMSRYRPDYISRVDSERLAADNPVCRALIQAANIEEVDTLEFPKLEFGKRNEAQLNRDLTDAQKGAAKMTPPLVRLVEALQTESPEAPSRRWQASYDLAYARALAAKVRVEGYNMALAELKRNSGFQQSGSTRWVLQPAAEPSDNSALKRGAAKSKELLEGLIKNHANTPWAYFAEKELAVPIGWRWTEQ